MTAPPPRPAPRREYRSPGWAIFSGGGPAAGLIGVGWFQESERWARHAGHNLMVWETRREARKALPAVRVRYGFPKARVVRVDVTVEVRRA